MSSLTNTANELSPSASPMESCPQPLSLGTCVSSYSPVQLEHTGDLQTWLQAASLANPSPLPASDKAQTTSATCGPLPSPPFARYNRASHSWRMSQGFLLQDISEPSWQTWPKAGMTHAGAFYPQPKWERRISEIASGLLPTPVVPNGGRHHNLDNITLEGNTLYRQDGSKAQMDLQTYVRMWPTPQARDWKGAQGQWYKAGQMDLPAAVGGKLNPTWCEWLMGWAVGWTSLEPLSLTSWKEWLDKNGCTSQRTNEETVSAMRQGNDSAALGKRQVGQHVRKEEVLQRGVLCRGINGGESEQGGIPEEGTENSGDEVLRKMRFDAESSEAPSRYNETPRGNGAMPDLPHSGRCSTWEVGTWWQQEPDIPRTTDGMTERVNRLKALGNGQVSVVAATAWHLLTEDL